MKVLFSILIILSNLPVNSQGVHADLYAGVANYQGDLQGKRFTFTNARPAFGLGLSYDITNKLIIRGAANYLKVAGKDETGDAAKSVLFRNLSFNSTVLEAQLALEYNLFDLEERNFTPYAFAGIAAFHFNPYALDQTGKKEYLRRLGTEGQGLPQYADKKQYKNNQLAIPFGGGIKFVLSDKLQVGVEIGLRKLFTDYFDDVSGTYADSSILASERGAKAAAFAYRGREINGNASYPVGGSVRGNSKSKDWYYTTGIRLSYSLSGIGNGGGSGRKSKTGCPVNVY